MAIMISLAISEDDPSVRELLRRTSQREHGEIGGGVCLAGEGCQLLVVLEEMEVS
jgi:hypothetical protein